MEKNKFKSFKPVLITLTIIATVLTTIIAALFLVIRFDTLDANQPGVLWELSSRVLWNLLMIAIPAVSIFASTKLRKKGLAIYLLAATGFSLFLMLIFWTELGYNQSLRSAISFFSSVNFIVLIPVLILSIINLVNLPKSHAHKDCECEQCDCAHDEEKK